jgi:fibronectin-binding autotransporter adhesin
MYVINSVGSNSTSNGQISKLTSSRSSGSGSPGRRAARAALLASAVLLCTRSIQTALAVDANATFTNTDANNSWSDAHNWSPAVEPNNGNAGNNYLVNVPAAPGAANVDADILIDGLTIASSAHVNILNDEELAIGSGTSSTLTNNGTITVNPGLGPNGTDLSFNSAGINLLTGSGSVVLTESGNSSEINTATGATLKVDTLQTIKGTGTINALMNNTGTINADNSGGTLALQTNAMSNSNIMEATGGGNLSIGGITITNTGTIQATGTGSTVTLNSGTVISGGTLSSGTGGSIVEAGSATSTLENGVTISSGSTFNISNSGQTNVSNTLTNNGTITVNSTVGPNGTVLDFSSGSILAGTGTVVLNNSGTAAELNGSLTQNLGSSITGIGQINATLTNNGTVNANISGGTLSLLSNMTNGGTMEATGGGILAIGGITVTNSGTIQATGTGSTVTLTNTTISGGTLSSGTGDSIAAVGGETTTLQNSVTIATGTTYNILNDGGTNVSGKLTNNGTLTVNLTAGANGTVLDFIGTGVNLLTGTGSVVLPGTNAQSEVATATGSTLTVDTQQTIKGAGTLAAAMTNNGTVNADISGNTMTLESDAMSNSNIMEATGGGNLTVSGITITNTGTIKATGNNGSGTNSSVTLSNATITGGTLTSDPADSIIAPGGETTTLEGGVTISSGTVYNIVNDGQTNVSGTLTNNGTITINPSAGANTTVLEFVGTGANLLTGNGSVVLPGTNAQSEVITPGGSTLTVDTLQTIKGAGIIAATMTNNGTINANISGNTMTLGGDPMSNSNIMEATGGGNLTISGITITNTGGTIKATGNNGSGVDSSITLSNATISGGTLTSDPADSINSPGGEATTLQGGVTISTGTIYNLLNDGQINVSGTLTNNGTLTVNLTAGANGTVLDFIGTGVNLLTGSGSVVLPGINTQSEVTTATGSSLTVDTLQTIKGAGIIAATMTNNGTINANISGNTMTLGGDPMSNSNIMEATGGGNLTISGITITNTGGTIKATGNNGSGVDSSITLSNATISGGTLTSDPADSINSPGGEATTLQGGVTISTGTHYNLLNDGTTNVSDTLTNNGTITVNSSVGPNGSDLDFSSGSVLAGTGTVVLNNVGNTAQILGSLTQNAGSSITGIGQIDATLANNGTVNANIGAGTLMLAGNPMSNGGTMEATGGGNLSISGITITNTGGTIKATGSGGGDNSTVTLAGTTITGGTLSTDSSGNILGFGTSTAVTKNNGIINANVNGDILNIDGNITGTGTLIASNGGDLVIGTNTGGSSQDAVSVTGANSKIDLTNNHLFINYGASADPAATIRGYLTTGYAAGAWNGPGIDSSTAALPANNSHYGLGYADGADNVVTGLTSGQIEIAYTLYGDANLDGIVSGDDFSILVANLGKSVTKWDQGDFNYDGAVTGDDFSLLVSNLGKAANGADIALPASTLAAIDAFAQANGLMADVPEPASLGVFALAGIVLLPRRRRHRC